MPGTGSSRSRQGEKEKKKRKKASWTSVTTATATTLQSSSPKSSSSSYPPLTLTDRRMEGCRLWKEGKKTVKKQPSLENKKTVPLKFLQESYLIVTEAEEAAVEVTDCCRRSRRLE